MTTVRQARELYENEFELMKQNEALDEEDEEVKKVEEDEDVET